MIEYMQQVHRILVAKGLRVYLTEAQQIIVEECFKRGNSVNSCVEILLE